MEDKKRCPWAEKDDLSKIHHDEIWGRACYNDDKIFKLLILEMFQAGLSWRTILEKEESFEKAFDDFDIKKISNYGEDKINKLLENEDIVRNDKKIRATVENAKAYLDVQEKYGSFSKYIWSYTFDTPIINPWSESSEVPSKNPLSEKICEDMKKMGFKFIGPTTIYSFLQSIGIINDHLLSCDFKYVD